MQAFVNNSEKAALNLILTTQDLNSAPKLDSSQSSQNKANFSEMISAAQKNYLKSQTVFYRSILKREIWIKRHIRFSV